MAEFGVGNVSKQIAPQGIRFERVAILGNAGKKIDAIVDLLLSPVVTDPKVPTPVEKKALEILGLTPTIEAKAFLDFLLGSGRKLNPAGSELPFGPLGVRLSLTPEQLAALQQLGITLFITPTWQADP